MNERVDPNDYVYLLAASRAGVQGTPIFFDEVPRVARLCADGLLVRLPSTEGRIYGSAVITEDAGRVLSRIASEELWALRAIKAEVSRLQSRVSELETALADSRK